MSMSTGRILTVGCMAALVAASAALAAEPAEVLALTGGTHLKAAWVKDKKTLQAFDTRSGQVRDLYTATEKEVTWP